GLGTGRAASCPPVRPIPNCKNVAGFGVPISLSKRARRFGFVYVNCAEIVLAGNHFDLHSRHSCRSGPGRLAFSLRMTARCDKLALLEFAIPPPNTSAGSIQGKEG